MCGLDLNDEDFLIISDENGASAVGGQDSANLNRHNVVLHTDSLWRCGQKTSVPVRAGESGKARSKKDPDSTVRCWCLELPAYLCFVSGVDNYNWPKQFRELFEDGMDAYRAGKHDAESMFDATQQKFLVEIGVTAQDIFDFVEDTFHGGDPGVETTLLITATRREYFASVQHGKPSKHVIDMDALPPKSAQLGGIEWLPRIIEKARAKLRGEMPPDLMYCCGGDRAFLREHGIHASDFLREVWAAGDDNKRILDFVRKSAADRPPDLPPGLLPDSSGRSREVLNDTR